jgi:hypothetical protein
MIKISSLYFFYPQRTQRFFAKKKHPKALLVFSSPDFDAETHKLVPEKT